MGFINGELQLIRAILMVESNQYSNGSSNDAAAEFTPVVAWLL